MGTFCRSLRSGPSLEFKVLGLAERCLDFGRLMWTSVASILKSDSTAAFHMVHIAVRSKIFRCKKAPGLGFWVWGLAFRVLDLGLGFGVYCLKLKSLNPKP